MTSTTSLAPQAGQLIYRTSLSKFIFTIIWVVLYELTLRSGSDDDSDNSTATIDDNCWPKCTETFTDIDTLESKKDSLPAYCVQRYLIDVQVATMEKALNDYSKLIGDGYDKKFSIYSDYMKDQLPEQMNAFMGDKRIDQYFKCKENKAVVCCNACSGWQGCGPLNGNCDKSQDCKPGTIGSTDMAACPKITSQVLTMAANAVPNTTWTLTDSTGFFKDLSTYGIEQSWIVFDSIDMEPLNGCQFAGANVKQCQAQTDMWYYNYPVLDVSKASIFNPKDMVQQALPNSNTMLQQIKLMKMFAPYNGLLLSSDMVDSTSLPAYAVDQAVASMQAIVKEADKIKKEEREQMILEFITGALMMIPFVGEEAGAAGLTAAQVALRAISDLGDVAMAVYGIVKDPKDAFMDIFGVLGVAGVGRDGFKAAAASRRALSSDDLGKLGSIKTNQDKVQDCKTGLCKTS